MPVGTSRAARAVVFDLDGTLVDSAPGIAAALAALGRARRPVRVERVRELVALSAEALVQDTLDLAVDEVPAALAEFRKLYARAPCQPDDLYPGARAALENVRRRNLKVGICTNKPQRLAEIVVERLEIGPLIDVVVGASPDRPTKPRPDMLIHALATLEVGRAAFYVGDTGIDAETARRAGVPFVAATFGYGEFGPQTECAATLARFDDLAGILSERWGEAS